MSHPLRFRLGEILCNDGLITQAQLDEGLALQKKTGEKIGKTLISLNFLTEEMLLTAIAKHLQIPYINLKSYPLDKELSKKLPERLARRYRMILLSKVNNDYLIGMVDPQNLMAIDEAAQQLGGNISAAVFKEKDCLETLDSIYRRTEEITRLAGKLEAQMTIPGLDIEQLEKNAALDDIPISRLIRSIFEDAIQVNASDIHIEPEENSLRIRYRIDGVLQEHVIKESKIAPLVTQRLKILAHLNIMEHRLPQDGHISLIIHKKNYDIRLSTLPMQYGESIVMRILEQGAKTLRLEELELPGNYLTVLRETLEAPFGLILTTGPTGSGKTTTLFALLNEINTSQRNIITIEDPIEYRLPGLNQVQVNPQINLTFANILRSSLRQDPDILMVGEIRDPETLAITLRAAMTGHLVLSTIHTNDSISTIDRMLDLEGEAFLVASTTRIIIAQRLLRRLCNNCQIDATPTPLQKTWLEQIKLDSSITFKIGKGCTYCNGTGYRGRFGIFEFLVMNKELSQALRVRNLNDFKELARKQHTPLWKSAIQAAIDHKTSLDEIIQFAITLED